MKTVVTLSNYEIFLAATVGVRRTIMSLRKGTRNIVGNPNFGWHCDIEASCAEMALAKYLGCFWAGVANLELANKEPDVAAAFQVRHTALPNGRLVIRPADNDNEQFVLVRGSAPEYEIAGWVYARDAKRDWYLHKPNGGPECWMVDELMDPALLKTNARNED